MGLHEPWNLVNLFLYGQHVRKEDSVEVSFWHGGQVVVKNVLMFERSLSDPNSQLRHNQIYTNVHKVQC